MTLDWLENLNWHADNGIFLPMINDYVRNQFYDRILRRYVKNQLCTDIGFGTGLLSLIALKHGAEHIRAFESDWTRYQLGQEIIRRCGLQTRIDLINDQYDNTVTATAVTFTETVDHNLWGEGAWSSLPPNADTVFLPGQYFLEVWACEIDLAFAVGLVNSSASHGFRPGIDLADDFVAVVNDLSGGQAADPCVLDAGSMYVLQERCTAWGWTPYTNAVQHGTCVGRYSVSQWQPDVISQNIQVSTQTWRNSIVLIVPRVGMQQDEDKLYLDTGHWGRVDDPVLLCKPIADLNISHDLRTGLINYNWEIQ